MARCSRGLVSSLVGIALQGGLAKHAPSCSQAPPRGMYARSGWEHDSRSRVHVIESLRDKGM
jgi:hypothetical protein